MDTFVPTKVSDLNRSDLPPYTRVGGNDTGWLNSDDTPLNAENLNKGDIALYHLLSETDGYLYRIISTLNSEITARESDDAKLAGSILSEETQRINKDTELQTNINSEATARSTADQQLRAAINTEINTRSTADTQLQNNINSEASTRSAADAQLQNNIDSEADARFTADNNLSSKISELSASITKSINELKNLLQGVDNSIKADLQTEIQRATTKEAEILNSAILDKDSILITCGSSTENI